MKRAEIEAWAIKQLIRVEEKRVIEDSAVELKSGLQDPAKTARRIAAHANAARGEPILWIVGADEKRFEICGAKPEEVDGWFKQVTSHFDGRVVPDLVDVAFDYKGKSVVALKFETDRAPYVVRDEKGRLEVPWREQTEPRSATRDELLTLLIARQMPLQDSLSHLLGLLVESTGGSPFHWSKHARYSQPLALKLKALREMQDALVEAQFRLTPLQEKCVVESAHEVLESLRSVTPVAFDLSGSQGLLWLSITNSATQLAKLFPYKTDRQPTESRPIIYGEDSFSLAFCELIQHMLMFEEAKGKALLEGTSNLEQE